MFTTPLLAEDSGRAAPQTGRATLKVHHINIHLRLIVLPSAGIVQPCPS